MKPSPKTIALASSLLLLNACSAYQSLGKANSSEADAIVTTARGMTLYTFDKDTDGVSACYDSCAAKWPPYLTSEATPAQAATKSKRKDGSEQWVLNGSPLYTWVGDKQAGETTGDGVGNVWHTARLSSRYKTTGYSSGY